MTNEQILYKAVAKAKKNGYRGYEMPTAITEHEKDIAKVALLTELVRKDFAPMIIFRHDFAKAFWGEERNVCKKCGSEEKLEMQHRKGPGFYCLICEKKLGIDDTEYKNGWRTHLQIMVITDDPTKYLKKFL